MDNRLKSLSIKHIESMWVQASNMGRYTPASNRDTHYKLEHVNKKIMLIKRALGLVITHQLHVNRGNLH